MIAGSACGTTGSACGQLDRRADNWIGVRTTGSACGQLDRRADNWIGVRTTGSACGQLDRRVREMLNEATADQCEGLINAKDPRCRMNGKPGLDGKLAILFISFDN